MTHSSFFLFFFLRGRPREERRRAQCDCRRFATLFRLSRSRGQTKILAARSRIILSYTYASLCVRIRPCIEPITVPPRQLIRVSRARSKLSPPEKRVAYAANFHHGAAFLREERILFFFFFFYPERTGQPAATKWGEKRFRWISNRGGIVGQSARLIGLDESTSTNDQGRTFHEFRARPCPSHFSRTQGEDSKTKVAGRGSERKDGMKEGSTGCWETPIKRTVTQSFNLIAARTRVHLVQPRSRQRPRPRFPRSG